MTNDWILEINFSRMNMPTFNGMFTCCFLEHFAQALLILMASWRRNWRKSMQQWRRRRIRVTKSTLLIREWMP